MWTYLFIGLIAGLIVSSWQGYKDPPWEGFFLYKFVRSIGIGGALGLVCFWLESRGLIAVDNMGLLLLAILATERLVGETYKGFFRRGPHNEFYRLFAKLHLPVADHRVKILFGMIFLAGGCSLYWLFGRLTARVLLAFGQNTVAALLIGGIAGTMVATGGALKDSQFEGFLPMKFIRSPIMGALGCTLLIKLSADPLMISLGAIGLERVLVEFYKTFLKRQIRGIHADKPLTHPQWLKRRWVFLVSFMSCVAFCGFLLFR